MLRFIVPTFALLLSLPFTAQAASLKERELSQMLQKVAKESSVGTPRAVNADIMDQGYTVKGKELIDHLAVRESHAVKMRSNPDTVRAQLGASVCRNNGYRQLMARGATLRYDFTEYKSKRPAATQRFVAEDCGITLQP